MDKKINGKNVTAVVEFKHFLFMPHFDQGKHAATFSLVAYYPERDGYIRTSDIAGIHEEEGEVYIETINSMYKLSNPRKPFNLEDVKKYFEGEFDSSDIFHNCVANEIITNHGWKIY